MAYLNSADAQTQIAILAECAARNNLKGADGMPLRFKCKRMVEDKRVKAAWVVVPVEMVRKQNLLNQTETGWFWIDKDTPLYLDPSSETYHSM